MKPIKDNNIQKPIEYNKSFVFAGISHKGLLEHIQKIARALYMISSYIEKEDYLVNALKKDTVDMVSKCALLASCDVSQESFIFSDIHKNFFQIQSYLEILSDSGLVSEMNYKIISSEIKKINLLIVDILNRESSRLDIKSQPIIDKLFLEKEIIHEQENLTQPPTRIESPISSFVKRHEEGKKSKEESLSLKRTSSSKVAPTKLPKNTSEKLSLKEKRQENILSILKQKKDASIKDICTLFKDCSSKTIQRDLAELIDQKKVMKRGDRRWSIYNLV